MEQILSFQAKLRNLVEQIDDLRSNDNSAVMIFYTNEKQEVCELLPPNAVPLATEKYVSAAYRLLLSGKPCCVINNKASEFAKKTSMSCADAFAAEHMNQLFIVFIITDNENTAIKLAKVKAEFTQILYDDLYLQMTSINAKAEQLQQYAESYSHLSHEFKTPLNVIQTSIQLLRLKLKKDNISFYENSYKQILEFTEANALKLSRLTANLLDCARANSNAMELVLSYESMGKCVNSTVEQMKTFAESHGVKLNFRSLCTLNDKCFFDIQKIDRIVLNLISNAIASLSEVDHKNKKIEVCTKDDSDNLFIIVTDNGKGFSKHDAEKLFNSFYTSGKNSGTGLGLTVTMVLAKLHNGSVKAVPLKNGAKFIVTISKKINACKSDELYSTYTAYSINTEDEFVASEKAALKSRLDK